ncbi:threonine synthase [Candidatus Neomarinimicrobiota bacterium]
MKKENTKRILGYKCVGCGEDYPVEPFLYQCTKCKSNLDVQYNYELIKEIWSVEDLKQFPYQSLWRYHPLLPVENPPENLSMQSGGTPLISFSNLQTDIGKINLYIKDDTRNPSGSLKDRATEVGIRHADELGKNTIVAASTGNAAASLAALAAFYEKKAVILAPASAPPAKLTQILQYGATLYPVDGTYDDAFNLSLLVAEANGWYSRSTAINPVLAEGKKTVGLEIAEQLNWHVPNKIFIPTGDGCIVAGIYKAFLDLVRLGWISKLPQLIAVQAEGSPAIVNALNSGKPIVPVQSKTIADSISVDLPRDGEKAILAVQKTKGFGITVSDDEILVAQHRLARNTGVFAEPAAAAAFAGFLKAMKRGTIHEGDSIVILASGTGLKDIPAAQEKIEIPKAQPATLEGFLNFYNKNKQK